MVAVTLLATWLLLAHRGRWSAYASGVAFVAAIVIKPTCMAMVAAAALSLAIGREWRRLVDFTVAGIVAAALSIVWANWVSDGVFTEVLLFQLGRIGPRRVGMWTVDSGFADMRRLAQIDTPWQLAAHLTWSRPWESYERRMRIFAVTETDAHLRLLASRGLVVSDGGPVPTWTLAVR